MSRAAAADYGEARCTLSMTFEEDSSGALGAARKED
jgi:hypothetical protein